MPIRNPFRRPAIDIQDENQPIGHDGGDPESRRPSPNPLDIKKPTEYKMSGMPPAILAFVEESTHCDAG
ncbi:hypothetical protein P152DRAFT_453903 [Eremomyces bilateralis CBS 781.70]|uniref:Uncharacterized protein n=1 Tax=Eremomyces bilateralis CBS 781.70 TaxID=1392243 RepID=A0A6G1GH38_9PEZI|nr:uncharacterized protein P152DRAFT_453903 [Eremomyces bilateralis CBS 781.70]KAF1817324.1 hypothetical protein P152DRAFT_453903 [Eremomyces bilateralis CBS 781.70]